MKRCYYINMRVAVALVIVAVVGCAVSAQAATTAYWRFEGNDGSFVADGTSVPTSGTPIRDEIGGNHAMAVGTDPTGVTWQGDDAGELFGALVPNPVPNPDPLDTNTNGTLNAGGINTRSLFFDGSAGDCLAIADNDALDFSGAFTVEGYFRSDDASYADGLLSKRNPGGDRAGYKMWLDAAHILHFGMSNGSTWGRVGFDDAALNDDVWHHFAAIRDAVGGLHIWVDGVEDVTPATNGTTTVSGDLSNDFDFIIGNDNRLLASNTWGGYLDEIRLSDAALTSEQFLFSGEPVEYLPGDANGDRVVDGLDAAVLAANWQKTGNATWADGDFNDDQNVDDIDATILAANWQTTSGTASVPEPASCVMIVVGLLTILLLRRKRNSGE